MALVGRIDALLNRQGYTIRGVQQLLAADAGTPASALSGLQAIRDSLARALTDDERESDVIA